MNGLIDFIRFESTDLISYHRDFDWNDKVSLKKNQGEILKCIKNLDGKIILEAQLREYKVDKAGNLLIRLGSPYTTDNQWVRPGVNYSGKYHYELNSPHFHLWGDVYLKDNIVEKLELKGCNAIDY